MISIRGSSQRRRRSSPFSSWRRRRTRPASSCRRRRASRTTKHCSQVRLVVVGALERRAPVVHRVEEQVVEHDPAALAHDPAVVDDPRVACRIDVVALRRRGGRAARDAAAQQQRGDQPGVDEPGGQADPREAARAREPLVLGPALPAARARSRRAASGTNRRNCASPGGGSPDRGQPLEVQLTGRDGDRAPRAGSGRSAGRTPRRTTRRPSGRTARRR